MSKLEIDNEFKEFQEDVDNGKYNSPLEVPLEIWGNLSWELLDKKTLENLLLPFLNFTFKRAVKVMPIYKGAYKKIQKIESFDDFKSIPILVKDSTSNTVGFRNKINENPYTLLPTDIKNNYHIYKSGGTKGTATPTFITPIDREIESRGFSRAFKYAGFKDSDRVLSTYNPTHKGGEEAKEAMVKIGAAYMPRRLTDTVEDVINTIKKYKINSIITTQGPISEGDKVAKGGGISLLSLIESGQDTLEEYIDKIVLGGYGVIDEVINWSKTYEKPIASLLGSSEAIPQAGSTLLQTNTKICNYNNLHLFNGPHYVEVVKEEDGIIVPVKKGETGLLVYTTIAREGTIYIRYAPGDEATLIKNESECTCGIKTEIISDIKRIDSPNDIISTGCCVG